LQNLVLRRLTRSGSSALGGRDLDRAKIADRTHESIAAMIKKS
jgi:hypothetical protein